ncbi:MAG: trypsin-like peptidase domain-containing protein [Egibacteraceae bacterium]
MRDQALTDGVVRVGGGTGFVVTADGLIVTCAHVVSDGGSPQHDAPPTTAVTVVFQATGEARQARIEPAYWRDRDHGDVAFLRVEGTLPAGVHPLALGLSAGAQGHPFSTFGYPASGPGGGMYGSGRLVDQIFDNGSELLQVTGASEVTRGFSGGPVFDETARRVIGVVTAITRPDKYGRLDRTAFVIPTETLRAVCAELEVSAVCPYRSLDAFREDDEEFFYGRERAVKAVLGGLENDRRFLAVLGPSGCGKSSLVQAGVLPRLRRGALAGSDRWGVIVARPGDDPFGQLGHNGLPLAGDLTAAARQWQATQPERERLVLVLDQFEELLVAAPEAVRSEFLEQLPAALEQAQPLTVLLVMRDDFYAPLAESAPQLMGWVERNLVNVPALLEAHELAAIVEQPARTVGLGFEAGLVDRIVADAITASGSISEGQGARSTVLPLLEFALTQLWERRADGRLTHEAYDQIGKVTGGLAQWCDRAFEGLDEELQPVAKTVVTALVHLGVEADGVPHSRRRRTIAELWPRPEQADAVREVVQHLAAARLLVTSRQDDGHETVELIHEALLREWGLLRQWLADDQKFLSWRQRIEQQATAWTASSPDGSRERDEGLLVRGRQLTEAEDWTAQRSGELLADVGAFVEASRQLQRRERERDRRRIRRLRALSAVLVVLLGVGWWQWRTARRQRDLATARQLAGQAAANVDQQPLSLLLSLESLRLAPTDEARATLLRGLLEPRHNVVALIGHTSGVYQVALSPDGATIVSASVDQTVRRWDARTGTPIGQPLTGHTDAVRGVAFSPDGTTIASTSGDHTVRLWDAVTGRPIGQPLTGHTEGVEAVTFSPDGTTIASASRDRTVRRWDVRTGKPIGEPLTGHTNWVMGVAFSPDGTTIASAGEDSTVRRWNARTGAPIGRPLTGHTDLVKDVVFSPDGATIASASEDSTVRRWNATTGAPLGQPLTGHTNWVVGVAFSPDGATIASASADGTVRRWNAHTGAPIGQPLIGHTDKVLAVAFTPDGETIVAAGEDGTVERWNAHTGAPIGQPLTGFVGPVAGVAFSPDRNTIAAASADRTVRLWPLSIDAWKDHACTLANRNLTQAEWSKFMPPGRPYARTCPNLPSG